MDIVNYVNELIESKPNYSHLWQHFHITSEIPLDQRWEAFCLAVRNNLLYNVTWCDGHLDVVASISGGELNLYDDFYIDRGQTISFPYLGDKLIEFVTPELYDAWREKVLLDTYTHFTYNW